ncbi:hypothetical protein BSKO_10307 [Bryopsis sp. KO-2023]|nr:hypothetical protein BSKO_10307 [Bryopsis sp. KO-2023]
MDYTRRMSCRQSWGEWSCQHAGVDGVLKNSKCDLDPGSLRSVELDTSLKKYRKTFLEVDSEGFAFAGIKKARGLQNWEGMNSDDCGADMADKMGKRRVKKRLDEIGNMESAMSMSQGQREKHKALNQFFHKTAKAKIKSVQEYVKDLVEQDQKLLIFAHHMEVLDGIEKALNQKKVKYIRIDGATAATKRDELKNDFQEKANVKVAILAIKAAGVGLNFTAANRVPGDIKQCEDRAHRIGQESDVVIRFLLARSSIDDMIWQMLQNKLTNIVQPVFMPTPTNTENMGELINRKIVGSGACCGTQGHCVYLDIFQCVWCIGSWLQSSFP